jgi:transcriptional regulator with XRE-family HTH domain
MPTRSNIENDLIVIGKKLKQLRMDAGYKSYETFANDYDIDRKQYWRAEKGANLTLRTVIKLIKIHKISLPEFFTGLYK